MNRAREIKETIDSLNLSIFVLQRELKDIQRHCKHPDKYITSTCSGSCKYACDDCGDSWWD